MRWPATTTSPGRTKEQAAEVVAKSMETGFRHIRLQYGEGGYGGGGFIPRRTKAIAPKAAIRARRSTRTCTSKPFRRSSNTCAPRSGSAPKLLHDVHSHLTARTRCSSRKKMEPYHMFFVEDLLRAGALDWYHEVRKVCATPQAVGEVFSNPAEYYPLIAEPRDRFHPHAA